MGVGQSNGDDPEIAFEPDVVVMLDETGEELSGYVGRGERPLTKRYRYEVGVVISRPGMETAVYASSIDRGELDKAHLTSNDDDLTGAIASATIVHVPVEQFHERLSDFSAAIIWIAIDVDELVTYAAALEAGERAYRVGDFPGFEKRGAVVAARVHERA